MGFKDAAEVANYIGGIFSTALEHPEIGPRLVGAGLVVAFDFTDPEAVVVIDMGNKSVREGHAGGAPAMATMAMKADTGNAFLQGKLNLPMAMAMRKIRVEGNMASLLKLAPLSKKLYPGYIQRLKDDGRHDLIV